MPVASLCKPVVAVMFAPVYALFTPSAYGVLLAVVDVMTVVIHYCFNKWKTHREV
jgi:hypothetical protein